MKTSSDPVQLPRVAVLGATGSVGRGILNVLDEVAFPVAKIYALASRSSQGTSVSCGDKTLGVQAAETFDFSQIDLLFSAVEGQIAKTFIPKALAAGAWVIDKSSHFRMQPDVPLIVPEVNGYVLDQPGMLSRRLIASPNCVATPLAMALAPLNRVAGVKRVVVSTYQSVSGAGKRALDELFAQARQILTQAPLTRDVFSQQIAFNVIPEIGPLNLAGDTDEESKVKEETQKLLGLSIPMAVTCVRVPVFVGHALSVWVELGEELSGAKARSTLDQAPGIRVGLRDREKGQSFTPLDCVNEDLALISRVRMDKTTPGAFSFWICCDNLRKGAALNAIQIAQQLYDRGLLTPKKARL